MSRPNIQIIKITDKNYPKLLKEIYDPPKEIYVLGKLEAEEKYPLAVVGTRKISNYGKQIVSSIVKDLAKIGLTIVSGLALGTDALAHQAALDVNGKTIAVLGSGLDMIYPRIHKKLAERIIKSGGAIISEYPPGTKPTKWTFPARNRIISGLSLGVLVIEAPERSGALITAHHALDQGREVFAVPGNIYSQNSVGCNNLIKLGAKAVTDANDILEALSLNLSLGKEKIIRPASKEEKIILEILSTSEKPIHIDEIIKKSKLETNIVNSTLTIMEISKKVKHLGGEYYTLNF
ncbi:DNA-processing protein DprA [bacterium]|nr:DNA-processing protein DprA [bacterium]